MKYLLLVFVSLFANLVNYFLAPVVVLFANNQGWLPRWLWWFQTPDYSLDGDDGWLLHKPFPIESNSFKRWINRTAWLYRNAMYGFSEEVLGFTLIDGHIYSVYGDETVGNRPLNNGLVERQIIQRDKTYWQWYYVKAWHSKYCIRINLGWKLWGQRTAGRKMQFVFSINPFMGYSK